MKPIAKQRVRMFLAAIAPYIEKKHNKGPSARKKERKKEGEKEKLLMIQILC